MKTISFSSALLTWDINALRVTLRGTIPSSYFYYWVKPWKHFWNLAFFFLFFQRLVNTTWNINVSRPKTIGEINLPCLNPSTRDINVPRVKTIGETNLPCLDLLSLYTLASCPLKKKLHRTAQEGECWGKTHKHMYVFFVCLIKEASLDLFGKSHQLRGSNSRWWLNRGSDPIQESVKRFWSYAESIKRFWSHIVNKEVLIPYRSQ